jgi:hypothetical protein
MPRLAPKTIFYLLILFTGSMILLMFLYLMYYQALELLVIGIQQKLTMSIEFIQQFINTSKNIVIDFFIELTKSIQKLYSQYNT